MTKRLKTTYVQSFRIRNHNCFSPTAPVIPPSTILYEYHSSCLQNLHISSRFTHTFPKPRWPTLWAAPQRLYCRHKWILLALLNPLCRHIFRGSWHKPQTAEKRWQEFSFWVNCSFKAACFLPHICVNVPALFCSSLRSAPSCSHTLKLW